MKRENDFLYLKLAQIIREQIMTGFIRPGQYLLSENELCRQYELSRSSVRKALDLLVEEGLIVKRVGQGTTVAPDLVIQKDQRKTLKLVATSPSFYIDYCMPFIIEAFRQTYPQVEVKLLSIPGAAMRDSFETSLEMGFQPDLLFVTDKQSQEFALHHREKFHDLRPVLSDRFDRMYPPLVRAFKFDGEVLAAPVSFSSVFMVYNARMFEAYGAKLPHPEWSKEDFITSARTLTRDTDGDGIADICGFSLPVSLSRWPAIAIAGGVRFQYDRDPDAMGRSMSFFHDLLFRERVATLAIRSSVNSEAFQRERAGMVLTTTFELADWRHNGLGFEPQVAPLPFSSEPSPLLIANAFMMPKVSAEQELAKQFMDVALSPEVQERILRQVQFVSVLPTVNETVWDLTKLQSMGLAKPSVENGHFLHELLTDYSMAADLERDMELFWAGLESAASFANRYFELMQSKG